MAEFRREPVLMAGEGWDDYRLLDSGHGRKWESFGPHSFVRPEPQALWTPRVADWQADGEFVPGADEDGGGRWQLSRAVPEQGWPLAWREARFTAQCTPFRHLGFFPDMAPVWDWMRGTLKGKPDAQTMNLFGYTGVGTLALSECGPVTHVDASKKSVAQARENALASGMEDRPIRWLVDDAAKFAAREVRRGNRYDGIILDPPKFGRGPKNETWRIEEGLGPLVADCRRLLDPDSRFLFLTVYAVRMSSLALGGLLAELFADLPGVVEHGELAVQEQGEGARLLPTAIFARWRNEG
ncbi:class I SAM-dependent rRNA methyltransferase [Erythrobacter sp. 3-20A1M]|uniref:class I SAM-dependent methyltransferase n=1 Tax=Erythrobacter sp. 3-20A1M TaxID=2653850 RepID=UPI001BFBFE68|nr:class I SAM-dependent methyltransferase [Erythrobacter sp. 3-20A1M]QWC57577.1 class I SAM-dependent rRNA methyltransferase [Erythrobacter sp. 3-20A1M]